MQQSKLIVVTGFLMWATCSLPAIFAIYDGSMTGWDAVIWWTAFIFFGIGLVIDTLVHPFTNRGNRAGMLLLIVMALCAFLMTFTAYDATKYTSSLTFMIVAGRLPYIASERMSWALTIGMAAIVITHYASYGGWPIVLSGGGAVTGMLLVAVNRSANDLRERKARAELVAVNAELHTTRELLAANSRAAERLRISRDLHDTLGHHLTALSIQLDVAARRSEGPATDHIREAHAITRLLLSDVRDVVGQLRVSGSMELADKLRELATSIGELSIHLEIPDKLRIDDTAQGETLVRCVQEVITNSRRHAAARNLWIKIAATPSGLELHARDDGCGAEPVKWGHGLMGMRERFAQHNGRVDVTSSSQGGFTVHAFLPQRETLA